MNLSAFFSHNKPYRVLMLAPHPSAKGGVAAYAQMLMRHLHGKVYPFWIGSSPLKQEHGLGTLGRLLRTPLTLLRLIRREKIDVVHLNPSLNGKSLLRDGLILLLLRIAGFRRTFVTFHGWQNQWEKRLLRNGALRCTARWLLNGTGHILVLSPEFRAALVAMGISADRISVTYTPFEGNMFSTSTTPPSSSDRRIILFMSRLIDAKGVFLLLEAFSHLANKYPDCDLLYAGEGEACQALQERRKDLGLTQRVHFAGHIEGAEKTHALTTCYLFALPTAYPEGLPIALVEAMAAGKPLLTSRAGGIGSFLQGAECGVVLPLPDVTSIEKGLRSLLDNPNLCSIWGEKNRALAWRHCEASGLSQTIEAHYLRIIQPSGESA